MNEKESKEVSKIVKNFAVTLVVIVIVIFTIYHFTNNEVSYGPDIKINSNWWDYYFVGF